MRLHLKLFHMLTVSGFSLRSPSSVTHIRFYFRGLWLGGGFSLLGILVGGSIWVLLVGSIFGTMACNWGSVGALFGDLYLGFWLGILVGVLYGFCAWHLYLGLWLGIPIWFLYVFWLGSICWIMVGGSVLGSSWLFMPVLFGSLVGCLCWCLFGRIFGVRFGSLFGSLLGV